LNVKCKVDIAILLFDNFGYGKEDQLLKDKK